MRTKEGEETVIWPYITTYFKINFNLLLRKTDNIDLLYNNCFELSVPCYFVSSYFKIKQFYFTQIIINTLLFFFTDFLPWTKLQFEQLKIKNFGHYRKQFCAVDWRTDIQNNNNKKKTTNKSLHEHTLNGQFLEIVAQ